MNKQEAFDKAALGLRSQGFLRSMTPDRVACVYDAADGKHCAFGWLIAGVQRPEVVGCPGDQRPSNEVTALDLMTFVPALAGLFDVGPEPGQFKDKVELRDFVADLQRCHDEAREYRVGDMPRKMLQKLRAFAERHGLSAEVLADVDEASLPEVVQ